MGIDDENAGVIAPSNDGVAQLLYSLFARPSRLFYDAGELAFGVFIDLADTRAGEHVVELVAKHRVPPLLGGPVHRSPRKGHHRGQRLRCDQLTLRSPVQPLGPALGGERPAMELEIELADPRRHV